MKKLLFALFALVMAVSFIVTSFAHSGKTDINGGHYDKSTGEYHYHHGYSAHQHYDMDGDGDKDCPYNFKDNTNHNNKINSNKTENKTENKKPIITTTKKQYSNIGSSYNEFNWTKFFEALFGGVLFSYLLSGLLSGIIINIAIKLKKPLPEKAEIPTMVTLFIIFEIIIGVFIYNS